MAWSQFTKTLFTTNERADREIDQPGRLQRQPQARAAKAQGDMRPLPLDVIGQRSESVKQRIEEMVDRLDDLKSLQQDFSAIMTPLSEMADELSRSSGRVTELDAMLAQEREQGTNARRELSEQVRRFTGIEADLATALSRSAQFETELNQRNEAVEELRIALRDKSLATENLERQLFSASEQAKSLQGENKALRLEAQATDQALTRVERELTELRERHQIADQDNRRLQILSEEQSVKLSDLENRHGELTAEAEAERQRLRAIETQLHTETTAREKNEAQYEAEIANHRTERASLSMKFEAAINRLASTEQLIAQLRNQIRDKDETARVVERNFKELSIERVTVDRRVESLQADLARQTERFIEMQRLRSELGSRCDMLTKALAAKDAAIEQAAAQGSMLTDRIEQLTRRHETDRAEFEVANRRMLEDLQTERSERAMALGALDIARESRLSLQKQYEALRRSGRGWRGDTVASVQEETLPTETSDNVRPFTAPTKGS